MNIDQAMSLPSEATMRLHLLRTSNVKAFRREINEALRKTRSYDGAGKALGLNPRTVRRWARLDPLLLAGVTLRGPGRPWDDRAEPKRKAKPRGSNAGIYATWCSMRRRCRKDGPPGYAGRGIAVCEGWQASFDAFLVDMGPKPTPAHSIDRIDNDGGYWCGKCPECVAANRPANCRWATKTEQARNTRLSRKLKHNKQEFTVSEWAERLGMPVSTLSARLDSGWSVKRALTEPVNAAMSRTEKPKQTVVSTSYDAPSLLSLTAR